VGDGLGLGQIPFSASHTSYTPPERRGRHVGVAQRRGPLALKPSKKLAGNPSVRTGGSKSILPSDLAPSDVHFLLAGKPIYDGVSAAASFVFHVFAFGLLGFLLSLAPERVIEVVESAPQNFPGIVWIPSVGPGGGGGGGGNESLEIPRVVEVEGADDAELSLPVEPEPEFLEPDTEPEVEPLQTQELSISAMFVASAAENRAGTLESLLSASNESRGSGSGGGAGVGEGTGIGPGQGDGLGPGEGGGTGGGVFRPGNGVNPPRVLREVRPEYTSAAMRARIQGTVWLEVVVLSDGTVGDVTVTKSLDTVFGLDAQAVEAARQWRFAPGTRAGESVAVLVGLELFFNLR